jgi:ADP-dependent phosphofructokinase/glucokinase
MGKWKMSRNGFPECEREYNARQEAVEMAREERREAMSDSPRTDEVWGSMHGSGYQMMLLAQKLERELATYREWAEVEIADLRDDVKRHIEIASFNAEDSLK